MKIARYWKLATTYLLFCVASALPGTNMAAVRDSAPGWDRAPVNENDLASLQNGARQFLRSCISCHSAQYMRYGRLQDIGLTMQDVHLLLAPAQKPQPEDTIQSVITAQQGIEWFGAAPPDLTLITKTHGNLRHNGADYVYTYLRSFYRDPTTRSGWNNTLVPHTAMPHVLSALQKKQDAEPELDGTSVGPDQPQSARYAEYAKTVGDTVNFMYWMADPDNAAREKTGWFICLYFVAFSFATWRLHASFWKEID